MSGTPTEGVAGYRRLIELDVPVSIVANDRWRDDLSTLLRSVGGKPTGSTSDDLAALQAALAPLPPDALDDPTATRVEQVLRGVRNAGTIVEPRALPTLHDLGATSPRNVERLSLWVGDITDLAADAVVNAANSTLLGCRIPYHFCIDYALHAEAGPRLRRDCDRMIRQQGRPEAVGSAKITRGYALPAPFVLHTVGPQLAPGSEPTGADENDLRSCYRSCLDVASEVAAVRTIAFCAISTGVFAYPKSEAAGVALRAVDEWLDGHPDRIERIVFNVFAEADADHYRKALGLIP